MDLSAIHWTNVKTYVVNTIEERLEWRIGRKELERAKEEGREEKSIREWMYIQGTGKVHRGDNNGMGKRNGGWRWQILSVCCAYGPNVCFVNPKEKEGRQERKGVSDFQLHPLKLPPASFPRFYSLLPSTIQFLSPMRCYWYASSVLTPSEAVLRSKDLSPRITSKKKSFASPSLRPLTSWSFGLKETCLSFAPQTLYSHCHFFLLSLPLLRKRNALTILKETVNRVLCVSSSLYKLWIS